MFKLPTLTLITVAGLLVATAETSAAAVVNGSFETGNFSDWNTSGQTSSIDKATQGARTTSYLALSYSQTQRTLGSVIIGRDFRML